MMWALFALIILAEWIAPWLQNMPSAFPAATSLIFHSAVPIEGGIMLVLH
jgi:hypothetical protein